MNKGSISRVVISEDGDRLYTLEYVASVTQISITVIEHLSTLGLISPAGTDRKSVV